MPALHVFVGEFCHVKEPNDGFQSYFSTVLPNEDIIPLAAIESPREHANLAGFLVFLERYHGAILTPYVSTHVNLQPAVEQHPFRGQKEFLIFTKRLKPYHF